MGKNVLKDKSIDRYTIGNLIIIAGIIVITTLEWHFFDWYQTFTKYGTLITFATLSLAFICYIDVKDALKDKRFWLMVITDIIALANLFIIGSNKGCLLIVVDFMLILYLSDKVKFSRPQSIFILGYTAFFFFYWTIDVKGYFKGYNTNYGGLILITGFAFLMVLMQLFNKKLKRYFWYPILYVAFIVVAFKIISWYRSRTALMGLLALLVLLIIPRKIIANKIVYTLLCVASTAGAIAFAGLYIFLGNLGDGEGIQLFYKSVISGRNEIWGELLTEAMKSPITGIGSSYEMKLEYMKGYFEAHSAMMDIFVVHGAIIFVLLCATFIYRLLKLRNQTAESGLGKVIIAAIMCMLFTGFFENYYIVQPFSMLLLCLFAIKPEIVLNEKQDKASVQNAQKEISH